MQKNLTALHSNTTMNTQNIHILAKKDLLTYHNTKQLTRTLLIRLYVSLWELQSCWLGSKIYEGYSVFL